MEFLRVVGTRRTIRWYKSWQPVPKAKIQRILEAARMCSSPGNIQPWRAIVVERDSLSDEIRDELLAADHWQAGHTQAPVWIYWYGDTSVTSTEGFRTTFQDPRNMAMMGPAAPRAFGWSQEGIMATFDGVEMEPGTAATHELVNNLNPQVSAMLAMSETLGACTIAVLAAVNEGLGTALHMMAAPSKQARVMEILKVPPHCVPVWLQLVGYPAEEPAAGGQRPRYEFDELFYEGQYGTPFPRDEAVIAQLEKEDLIQAPMPTPGRMDELLFLARMFGYPEVV